MNGISNKVSLTEGNIQNIDDENVTVAVSTDVPKELGKVEKDDKQSFEEFKILYKDVIAMKCKQDFGDCEDQKLWEDAAKELFLQSKNYILDGEEFRSKENLQEEPEKEKKTENVIVTPQVIKENNENEFDNIKPGDEFVNEAGSKIVMLEPTETDEYNFKIINTNTNEEGTGKFSCTFMRDLLKDNHYKKVESKITEKLNSNELITFSKKFLEAESEEDLEKLCNEIQFYSEPTYKRVKEIIDGEGSVQYKAQQISDMLYQINDPKGLFEDINSDDKCIMCGSEDLAGCYSLKGNSICKECGKKYSLPEIETRLEKKTENAEDFVSLIDNIKKMDLWDGKDETFKDAVEKYYSILDTQSKLKNEGTILSEEQLREEADSPEFKYQLLDRLKSDCEYFLKAGNRNEKHLWAGNVDDQIAKMKELWNSLEEKPEWLSMEDIENYEKEMNSDKVEESMPDDWYSEMFNKYVPKNGEADTTGGEILRLFSSISHMFFQNGDKIWRGNSANNSQVLDPKADKLYDLLPQEGKDLMEKMASSTTSSAYEKRLNKLEDYIYNYLKNNNNLFESKLQETYDISYHLAEYDKVLRNDNDTYCVKVENRTAQTETKWLLVDKAYVEKMKELENNYKQEESKLNESKLSDEEIQILRKRMTDTVKQHQKFNNEEDLEKYIDEFMPMWIEMQQNLGTHLTEESIEEKTTLEEDKFFNLYQSFNNLYGINKMNPSELIEFINDLKKMNRISDKDFNVMNDYANKWQDLINKTGYESNIVDESKEVKTEDQYEAERRKGRPNLDKIAKEVFEYDDYYINVVDNYKDEWDFVKDNVAEVAAEYNLREQAAEAVMRKIYKMAKETIKK